MSDGFLYQKRCGKCGQQYETEYFNVKICPDCWDKQQGGFF